MKLGILAFDIGDSYDITDIVQYAVKAEEYGFNRFWLGEHYAQKTWCNPEALIPIILGMTETINVGAAGILLNLHSSFRVALNFKLINAFFPGRVDLGLAKGGSDEINITHLMDVASFTPNTIDSKIEKIYDYYNKEDELLAKGIYVSPFKYPTPHVWLLGLSHRGLGDALKYKYSFSRSLFHQTADPNYYKDELCAYKEKYFELYKEQPKINYSFAGICAESIEKANEMYEQSDYYNNTFIKANLLGCKNYFQDKLHEYEENYGINEFIFLDLSLSMKHKMDTLNTLSNVLHLV